MFFARSFLPPSQSYFLFGPRGTGKSTLAKRLYPDGHWINLLDPETFRAYSARPERLFDFVRSLPKQSTIIIDEVQKAPELLSVVHALIEENKEWQFILTGSSARKLKKVGADLLAGRALKKSLHPFIATELATEFSLETALDAGLLPLVVNTQSATETLQTYVGMYLKEEIQAEGLVRNLDNFSRFLEVISFSHATQLNVTNIARECEVKRKTVENYIDILEDLLLAYKLQVFSKRAQRALSQHPKLYLFDTGFFKALRPKGPLDRATEIDGAGLEGLVAQHLRAWSDYNTQPHDLYFWRTASGVEVDFVVYGPQGFWAIEVKNSTKVHPADTKPLETFLEDYPEAKAILLYRGKETLLQKNVLCMPCEQFLKTVRPNIPLL